MEYNPEEYTYTYKHEDPNMDHINKLMYDVSMEHRNKVIEYEKRKQELKEEYIEMNSDYLDALENLNEKRKSYVLTNNINEECRKHKYDFFKDISDIYHHEPHLKKLTEIKRNKHVPCSNFAFKCKECGRIILSRPRFSGDDLYGNVKYC